jgi:hypothetical protein
MVEHDVSKTDNATLAWAIYDTKFDAVPPGEQPTSNKPRNNSFPNRVVRIANILRLVAVVFETERVDCIVGWNIRNDDDDNHDANDDTIADVAAVVRNSLILSHFDNVVVVVVMFDHSSYSDHDD